MNKRKFIPEVNFLFSPLELESDLMYNFSNPENSAWVEVFYKRYPELKSIWEGSKDDKEIEEKIQDLTQRTIKDNESEISNARSFIKKDWDTVSNEFLTTLSEHFQTEWPEDKKTIIGYISILSVNPRFLDSYSFCVNFRNPQKARETIAHEILHFLWFKKWKEVFPETPRKEYERPYLTWRLSEIMDPVILQCNPKIKELIKPESWGYGSFENLKIGDIGMTEHFARIYKDCLKTKKSFEEILKITWEEAQKHKDVLEKF